MYSIIPLSGTPNNKTTYRIPIDNKNLSLTIRLTYNEIADYWSADIADASGTMLISALPLIPGQDILEQYKYMGIGSAVIVPRSKVTEQWPTYSTLTSAWYLVWSDTHVND